MASFWRRPSKSLKEEVATGVVCCPCGKETRVMVFRAMTKRRPTSPDLVAYAVPGVGGVDGNGDAREAAAADEPRAIFPTANLPHPPPINAPSASTTGTPAQPDHAEALEPSEATPTQKIEHRLSGRALSSRPQLERAKRTPCAAVLGLCLPQGKARLSESRGSGRGCSRPESGRIVAAFGSMKERAR